LALVELSVVEQRYRAVLEAASGVPVIEVAERFGVLAGDPGEQVTAAGAVPDGGQPYRGGPVEFDRVVLVRHAPAEPSPSVLNSAG